MDSTPSPHPELDDFAIALFRLVSRVEYALKVTGRLIRLDGAAQPNWDRFASDVEAAFAAVDDSDFAAAVDYLLAHPPRQQMVRGGVIGWEDAAHDPQQPRARLVFSHVRQVRNNLFHGGKFNGGWFEPQRSRKLIEACLVILRRAVDLDPGLQAAFHGA